MKKYQWYSGCGRLSMELSQAVAESCNHRGACDADVAAAIAGDIDGTRAALEALDMDAVRAYLAETGLERGIPGPYTCALEYVLWIAAGDLCEEMEHTACPECGAWGECVPEDERDGYSAPLCADCAD
jgi:hypothetical protein